MASFGGCERLSHNSFTEVLTSVTISSNRKVKVKISEMKAVIEVGSKQYLVEQGVEIDVDLLHTIQDKAVTFTPLTVIDDDKVRSRTADIG